jgi:hypothetical protein
MAFLRLYGQRPTQHLTHGFDIHPGQFFGVNLLLPSFARKPFVEQQLVGHHAKRIHVGGIIPAGILGSFGSRVGAPYRKRNAHPLERSTNTKTRHASIGVGHEHIARMKKTMLGAFTCTKVDGFRYPPDNPRHVARGGRSSSPGHDVQRFAGDVFGREIRRRPLESGPNVRGNCRMR